MHQSFTTSLLRASAAKKERVRYKFSPWGEKPKDKDPEEDRMSESAKWRNFVYHKSNRVFFRVHFDQHGKFRDYLWLSAGCMDPECCQTPALRWERKMPLELDMTNRYRNSKIIRSLYGATDQVIQTNSELIHELD